MLFKMHNRSEANVSTNAIQAKQVFNNGVNPIIILNRVYTTINKIIAKHIKQQHFKLELHEIRAHD